MELWIVLTLMAAGIQNARTILQKNLAGRLSAEGATYARFLYGVPLAWLAVWVALRWTGAALPAPTPFFFAIVLMGGTSQILGNVLFVHLIRASNFTVLTTYIKIETVIGAVFGYVFLGDHLSPLGIAGVFVTLFGVMVLAAGQGTVTLWSLITSLARKEALYAVGVGALYAVASSSGRGAALGLGDGNITVQALYTLAWVLTLQAITMGGWMMWKSPVMFRETLRAWKSASWVGITGVTASACWYLAFTAQVIAYVLAVGQAEVILAYVVSHFFFKERIRAVEILGILITIAGIIAVVMAK